MTRTTAAWILAAIRNDGNRRSYTQGVGGRVPHRPFVPNRLWTTDHAQQRSKMAALRFTLISKLHQINIVNMFV
jgi:hypothetical protein